MLDEQISRPPRTPEGPPVVVAAGDIDLAVAPSLRESLAELLDAGHCDIVVDLIDATFLDSVALGVLVGALEQCRQAGGDLHLVVTDPRILRVLGITGLASTFTTHSSRDELRRAARAGLPGHLGQVSRQ